MWLHAFSCFPPRGDRLGLRLWCWTLLVLCCQSELAFAEGMPPQGAAAVESPGAERGDDPVRYVIDGVSIRGNSRTSDQVILRFVPFAAGDVLDVEDPSLTLTRYRLLGTGFFRDVTLALEKGTARGRVVLVIQVAERNTIVVGDLWMGLAASADTRGQQSLLGAFAGIDAAETNLLGSGITLGGAAAFSNDQRALSVRFLDPAFLIGPWMLGGELLVNDALGYFGNANVRWDDPNQVSEVPRQAVAQFLRFGTHLGIGRDLSVASQLWLSYRIDAIRSKLPLAAAHDYGGQREPIDFRVMRGRSVLSSVRAMVQHDTRDQPLLTNRGTLATWRGELAFAPLGSSYSYQRVEGAIARWWPMAHDHVLKLEGFLGIITGNAPFFEQFYIGDLSDFRPGRVLGLAFDDRPAPNFFGTSIAEIRYGDYAAKINAEYRIPLYRGNRSVYGVDLFASWGLLSLASERDLRRPPRDLSGLRHIPVDMTANLGVQMDTSLGGFSFAFANLIGFAPGLGHN